MKSVIKIQFKNGDLIGGKMTIIKSISISPVNYKIFVFCVLKRYRRSFNASENQFGFKPGLGCSHAINTVPTELLHIFF